MRGTGDKAADAVRKARGGFIAVVSWGLLLAGAALLLQSAPQAQSSPTPQFCYPAEAESATCFVSQSKAEAAMRADALPSGRLVEWRRTDGELAPNATVYGLRRFTYTIPNEAADQLYSPSYWRIRSESIAHIAPGCTASGDPNMAGTCADEGETVARMMQAYAEARPDCSYSPPVLVTERPFGYQDVTFDITSSPRHGYVDYGKRVYRTVRTCSSGVANLDFQIGKMASFTCPSGSSGLTDNTVYGDGIRDIELPVLCKNDTKRYIDGPMLQVASCPANGNPCYPATGDKARFETDFEFAGRSFTRVYHSLNQLSAGLGMAPGWTHGFAMRLEGATSGLPTLVGADGYYETFVAIGSDRYRAENSQDRVLERVTGAFPVIWRLRDGSGEVHEFDSLGRRIALRRPDDPLRDLSFGYYNTQSSTQGPLAAAGYLRTVTDAQGRQLRFEYGVHQQLSRIVKPDGSAVSYGYDAIGNLVSADYGAGRIKRYHYAESGLIGDASQRHHLTGITAESGLRYASFRYDAQGRVTESRVHGEPNEVTSVAYTGDNEATVTTANGLERVYSYQPGLYRRNTGVQDGTESRLREYDPVTGRLIRSTDKRGVVTEYEYVAGHRSATIEAVGTPQQRREEIDRDPATQRVVEMRTKNAVGALVARSTMAYNSRGQVTSLTAHDPATGASRTSATAYCEAADVTAGTCPLVGLVKRIDGPRSDVVDAVTFTYRQTDHPDCAAAPTTCAWRKGDLWKTTNALGHVIEVLSYDGAGRATSIRDPNGITTTLQYDPRGWLTRRTTFGADPSSGSDDAVTELQYTADGLVHTLIKPDHSFALFRYDDGQRLVRAEDSDGNAIVYTLNAAGERKAERTYDLTGALTRVQSRDFDTLGRLARIADAYNASTVFAYDAEGNRTGSTDPLLRSNGSAYDPLGRLSASIDNAGAPAGASDRAETAFFYDALDRLTRVTDPKGLHTDYGYNGYGELTRLTSPDTGTTTYRYDLPGHRTQQIDARGKVTDYTYDALNRPTAVRYPQEPALDVVYTYDTAQSDCLAGETFLIGRLAKMIDHSGSTTYCHDRFGHLTRKVQRTMGMTLTQQWQYAANGRLLSMTYPDGAVVDYVHDSLGRVVEIGLTQSRGSREQVLRDATYYPFGAVAQWTYGNGRMLRRTQNLNGQPGIVQDTAAGGISLGYQFDAAGNLIALRNGHQNDPALRAYGYDGLNRLTSVRDAADVAQGTYGYDKTGNRMASGQLVTTPGQSCANTPPGQPCTPSGPVSTWTTRSYGYLPNDHHLRTIGNTERRYDAAGNTVWIGPRSLEFAPPPSGDPPPGDPLESAAYSGTEQTGVGLEDGNPAPGGVTRSFVYSAANRMASVSQDGALMMSYRYNGAGERVYRSGSGQTAHTVFDPAGRWIGDYDEYGQLVQQAIWLGDLPVGMLARVAGGQRKLFYLQPDALGTPRVVIDPTRGTQGEAVWRWELESEAFGETAPNEDPDGDSTLFVLDLRYPGQQYDSATGFNYNYFRDYDARAGRYVQGDPIGLSGGINVYAYVFGSPLTQFDFFGLAAEINWYPPRDIDLHNGSNAYVSPPGTFTIAAHGIIGSLEIRDLNGNSLDAQEVWSMIQDRVTKGKYKRIRLISCATGAQIYNGRSFASDLANISGLTVEAPLEYIGFKNGQVVMGPPIPRTTPPLLRINRGATFGRFSRSCQTFSNQCY